MRNHVTHLLPSVLKPIFQMGSFCISLSSFRSTTPFPFDSFLHQNRWFSLLSQLCPSAGRLHSVQPEGRNILIFPTAVPTSRHREEGGPHPLGNCPMTGEPWWPSLHLPHPLDQLSNLAHSHLWCLAVAQLYKPRQPPSWVGGHSQSR